MPFCQGFPGAMCLLVTPCSVSHSPRSWAMNSGPLSLRRIVGLPKVSNAALSTAFTSMDVKAVAQRMARERRVNSSVRVRIFRAVPWLVWSKMKS